MYYVYILRCKDNSLYAGITTDPQRRLQEHREHTTSYSKYTTSHAPIAMERVWQTENRYLASQLEYRIKRLSKAKKEELIRDPSLLTVYFEAVLDSSAYTVIA